MIVRDEERQLAECLGPVASLFDELIVVDTGSVDATRRIASTYAARIFDFPWCDDFSAARNESLRRSRGDWVFWLDADDRISDDNIIRLRTLLAGLSERPRVYYMNTACSSQYACEGERLITHTRLFRRHPSLCWQGRVHEQLRPEPTTLGHELVWSDVLIHHIGYRDEAALQRKLNRDLRLLRMDYSVDPDDCSTLVHLGLAYFHLGHWNEARQHLRKVLQLTKMAGEHLRQVYATLATLEMREGNVPQALATLDRGLSIFPHGEYLLFLRAECLYELDRYSEAKTTLSQILSSREGMQYRGGVPAEIREKLAPLKLADVLRLERKFSAAENLLFAVLSQFPNDTHSWYLLGRIYHDSRLQGRLLAVVERLRACPQGEIFAPLLLAEWRLEQRELEYATQLIDEVIGAAPRMPFPRMLRAVCLTRAGAPVSDRIQACRDILRLQPGDLDARRMLAELESSRRPAAAAARPASITLISSPGLPGVVAH